ncbi:MAG: mechanosensitive ion channel [Bordetella sp.]|nr:MAG: mechanosensitive ion channel [Bordetella sp.]
MKWDKLVKDFSNYIPQSDWIQTVLVASTLIAILLFIQWIIARLVLWITNRILVLIGYKEWDAIFTKRKVYQNIWYAVPFFVISTGVEFIPHIDGVVELIRRVAYSGLWICLFIALAGILDSFQDIHSISIKAKNRSIKGYIQIGKLFLFIICTVLVLSILIGRSLLWMISGLGALSAVLLLVFKDTLLSLVASTQLITNDMLRIGDWIQMPQSNADGFVRDIALHTVKVQNLDNTVTTIPTYKLFSESYRNNRQMFESGGRRIKRTLLIDASSIRFLNFKDYQELNRFELLHDYIQKKTFHFQKVDNNLGVSSHDSSTDKYLLTNIGMFRAYALAYLREHPELRKDMMMMVRMMEPSSNGIPIEIYCFTALTALIEHERIQGDIFDHFLAILPELKLRLYQRPSGSEFSEILQPISRVYLENHLNDE